LTYSTQLKAPSNIVTCKLELLLELLIPGARLCRRAKQRELEELELHEPGKEASLGKNKDEGRARAIKGALRHACHVLIFSRCSFRKRINLLNRF
jgi:hypothetical protein